jgi:hypothetical protein
MELQDTCILPPIYLQWIEESTVCDAPTLDLQSTPIEIPAVKEDFSQHSPFDSPNLVATSTDSNPNNLLDDCLQSSPTRTSTRTSGHSASSEVWSTDSKLEVILNSAGKDIGVNKSKNNDKVSDQSRLIIRNSNRLKKNLPLKRMIFYGCNTTFLF